MKNNNDDDFPNETDSDGTSKVQASSYSRLITLFEEELKTIYWAERSIKRAIPRMIEQAVTEELIETLDNHYAQTKMHVMRVEQIFKLLGKKAIAEKCQAMEELIKESEILIRENEKGPMRDTAIISSAQKIEHYEIAAYGTLHQFALSLGMPSIAKLLEQILSEEKRANDDLTIVAVYEVNILAEE